MNDVLTVHIIFRERIHIGITASFSNLKRIFKMLEDKTVLLVKLKLFSSLFRELFGAVMYDPATEVSSNAPGGVFSEFTLRY